MSRPSILLPIVFLPARYGRLPVIQGEALMIANKLNSEKPIIPSSLFPTQDAAVYQAGFGFSLSVYDHRSRETDPVEAGRRLDPE
jgi:hypothetical protein